MARATVNGIDITKIASAPMRNPYWGMGGSESSSARAKRWDWYGAASAANSYVKVGTIAGGIPGCVGMGIAGGVSLGAVSGPAGAVAGASVGCISGGKVGAIAGGVLGGFVGWGLGGTGHPWANAADGLDHVITP
jgi:hypothetical protein